MKTEKKDSIFYIEFDPWDWGKDGSIARDTIKCIKRMKYKNYNPDTKTWAIPAIKREMDKIFAVRDKYIIKDQYRLDTPELDKVVEEFLAQFDDSRIVCNLKQGKDYDTQGSIVQFHGEACRQLRPITGDRNGDTPRIIIEGEGLADRFGEDYNASRIHSRVPRVSQGVV